MLYACWAGQYPVAMQPSAKGFFPENHKRFLGTYWGQVSSPYCSEVVESCDVYMFVGAIHNDYSSVGYSLLLKKEKMIDVSLSSLSASSVLRVCVRDVRACVCVHDLVVYCSFDCGCHPHWLQQCWLCLIAEGHDDNSPLPTGSLPLLDPDIVLTRHITIAVSA